MWGFQIAKELSLDELLCTEACYFIENWIKLKLTWEEEKERERGLDKYPKAY